MNKFYKRLAFGIAEVSVSLAVVGMVAAMTIPSLIENRQEESTIMALRKAYALLSDVFTFAVLDNGTPDNWNLNGAGNTVGLANMNAIFSKYLGIAQNCGIQQGCFAQNYKNLKGNTIAAQLDKDTTYTKMVLYNGTAISMTQFNSDCSGTWGKTYALQNVCGMICVDINGAKGPNMYGSDYFGFLLTKDGIIPTGRPDQSNYPFNGFCNKKSNANKTFEDGLSCTAWVLYNNNIDYLSCNNLNWNSNTECHY